MSGPESLVVRVRTDDDLPSAAAALVDVHRTDGYPVEGVADPVAWLTRPEPLRAWVAVAGVQVVGHVALSDPSSGDAAAAFWRAETDDARPVVLGRLFVVQAARGSALGVRLLSAATAHARLLGRRAVLDVMVKDAAAIQLYERCGWRRTGTAAHDTGRGTTVTAYCYVAPE